MAIKNYMINDKWLDISKQNIVEVQSEDGVIGSVKVNGEDYGGGGGGTEWQTVFEGSVTTHDDDGEIFGIIEDLTLNGNSIRVTFNGAVYELPKTEHGYGSENDSGIDFSTYPLFIATGGGLDSCTLWTPTAGTYTLKIEEEQSGGSSDFSTAEVSVEGDGSIDLYCNFIDTDSLGYAPTVGGGESVNIPIYKNGTMAYIEAAGTISVSGSIVQTDPSYYLISGDCTITIS